jgi:hypothetical protein
MCAQRLCFRVGNSTRSHSKRVLPDCAAYVLPHSVSVLSDPCVSWFVLVLGGKDHVCGHHMKAAHVFGMVHWLFYAQEHCASV